MDKMTEQMAIETHIEECKRRIENIENFAKTVSDADKEGCALNVVTLQTAIQALEEIQQYRAIGTVEELQALKEKSVAKKPIEQSTDEKTHYKCECGRLLFTYYPSDGISYGSRRKYCDYCGQLLDWE